MKRKREKAMVGGGAVGKVTLRDSDTVKVPGRAAGPAADMRADGRGLHDLDIFGCYFTGKFMYCTGLDQVRLVELRCNTNVDISLDFSLGCFLIPTRRKKSPFF